MEKNGPPFKRMDLDYSFLLPSGDNLKDILKKENNHFCGGIGFRFIHKFIHIAIVRIDYRFSLKDLSKKGHSFGIGQSFYIYLNV